MKRLFRILLPLAVIAVGILVFRLLVATRKEVPLRPAVAYAPVVQTWILHPQRRTLIVRTRGAVRSLRRSTLAAEVSGRIMERGKGFEDGAFLPAGALLLKLDPEDYRLALRNAEAQLARAEAALELEEGRGEVAREDWRQLGRGEPTPLALRQPQLRSARADVEAARAARDRADRDLARCEIRVPFACRLVSRQAEVGQWVAPGTPLAVIDGTDTFEVPLPLALSDLDALGIGLGPVSDPLPVRLHARIGDREREWSARLVRTQGELDPATRMVRAVARIDDPYALREDSTHAPLAPGLFVEAEIRGRVVEDVYALPRKAVLPGDRCLIVDGDLHLHARTLTVLRREEDEVLVDEGLQDGERLCLSPIPDFVEGMAVRIASAGKQP